MSVVELVCSKPVGACLGDKIVMVQIRVRRFYPDSFLRRYGPVRPYRIWVCGGAPAAGEPVNREVEEVMEFWNTYALPFFKNIQVTDIIDILLVAFIVYHVIKFLRQTRAAQLIKGIAILLAVMYLSDWLQLNVINFILINTMQVGVTALLIVFQPELRRGLEHMGRSKFGSLFSFEEHRQLSDLIDEICLAVSSMSKTRTGALIIFERKTKLNDMLTGGTDVNSDISSELIENIFVPNTPLHDGAVIIRNGRIFKAACVLPLSSNKNLSKEFGTRHRAALGISEQTDCVGLVVSEETGKISVAVNGDMLRSLSISSLSRVLNKLVDKESENEKKNRAAKFFRGRERK